MMCACGLSYCEDVPEDEARHARDHDEFELGAVLPTLKAIAPSMSVRGFCFYHIDRTIAEPIRHELAHLAMVAHRSTPSFPAGYDGAVTDDDQRAFILGNGERGIGLVVTYVERFQWHLSWVNDGSVELLADEQIERSEHAVARLWIANGYRRIGLASEIVISAASILQKPVDQLGWELPLTLSGAHVLRRVCPTRWWGCGDGHVLGATLEGAFEL